MQSSMHTVSTTTTRLLADYLIIAFALMFVCFDYVRNEFKQGMTVEGTVPINYAEFILFGLCLLSLLVVWAR